MRYTTPLKYRNTTSGRLFALNSDENRVFNSATTMACSGCSNSTVPPLSDAQIEGSLCTFELPGPSFGASRVERDGMKLFETTRRFAAFTYIQGRAPEGSAGTLTLLGRTLAA